MPTFSDIAEKFISKKLIAGLEWDIRIKNKVLSNGVAGSKDARSHDLLQEGQIYRIYSMTKPIVSMACIRLIERNKIHLNSIAQEFIPSLKSLKIIRPGGILERLKRPITIVDLLTHTAGFSYSFNIGCQVASFYKEANLLNRPSLSLKEFVEEIAALPLAFQPGEDWRYSVSIDVLGRILEVLEGKRLEDILRELIFDPLGMYETAFSINRGQKSRLMPMHGTNNFNDLISLNQKDLKVVDIEKTHPSQGPNIQERGGGGLFSTVKDYQLFCNFLLTRKDKEGTALISPMMHEFILKNRIPEKLLPLKLGPRLLDGYGWNLIGRIMIDSSQAMSLTNNGEYGWAGAASTFFWLDQQKKLSGVLMTQFTGRDLNLANEFRAASYSAL
ncbi:beta-lactamase family protein [Paracoccaceae bacterium]|nr:beta-lactamase family protein [Paracoccaceae bacterium]